MKNLQWLQRFFLVLMLTLAVGLAACQEDGDQEDSDNQEDVEETEETEDTEDTESDENEESEESESAEADSYPVTFTDKSGEEVTIEEAPESIVSVIPSATEGVFAVGAGDQVVGVSEWANYPEEVHDIEKVGDMNLNIEQIVSLEPDVVIADLDNGESVEALREAGLNVVVLGAQSLEEVYEDLELLGQATGNVEEANDVIENMQAEVEAVEEAVAEVPEDERKSVWMEVGPELYSGGEGSFLDQLITLAGGENIIGDEQGWPQVSEEVIIERDPDVIITTYGATTEDAEEQVLSREQWQGITAIENEEVYDVHTDIVSRSGPRLAEGLRAIAEILYPDYVSE
ncbi:ABC transporter substrate-binding protein [Halalkalibacillus halophilus]|uniref:ABC transporter substrate-binding protein n=1 Tax=Halalkalibacillus halophilus TaxID=392827 RepID=UPI0004259A89|nr:ABC transporter substrate-binding protein [Halalkalibacillus halophilus]